MKRAIITLIIALTVVSLSFFFTLRYLDGVVWEESTEIAKKEAGRLTSVLDRGVSRLEMEVYTFMCGVMNYDNETGNSLHRSQFTIDDYELYNYSIPFIYEMLDDFIDVTDVFRSAMMIVEPGNLPETNDGVAAMRLNNDTTHYDLLDYYDIFKSRHYKALSDSTYSSYWTHPLESMIDGDWVMAFYVPIKKSDGSQYGAFVVDMSCAYIRDYLTSLLKWEGSFFVINRTDDGSLVMSTRPDGVDLEDYTATVTEMKHLPWRITVYDDPQVVFASVRSISRTVWLICLGALLVMALCSYLIYRSLLGMVRKQASVDNELRLASETQSKMLPEGSLSGDGFSLDAVLIPAREVGGDLFDYAVRDGKLFFCVGDVSGKGMSAALMMSQAVSLFRSSYLSLESPSAIMQSMNDVLCRCNEQLMFCTLFIGVMDIPTGTIAFSNAGHNSPVVVIGGKASLVEMEANVPLGLMEGFEYCEQTVSLGVGDTISIYTDGVTEACSSDGTLFGDERLVDVMQGGEDLLAAVKSFSKGAQQSDDITILTIKKS